MLFKYLWGRKKKKNCAHREWITSLRNWTFLDFSKRNLTRLTREESMWAGNLDSQLCQLILNNLARDKEFHINITWKCQERAVLKQMLTWANEILCVWIPLKLKKNILETYPVAAWHGIHSVNSDLFGSKFPRAPAFQSCMFQQFWFSV